MARLRQPELRGLAVYGAATALGALLTLVLTRVLWIGLTPAEFGVWALIDPMLLPIASLLLLGIDHAIVKQLRIDGLPLRTVVGTLLASSVPVMAPALLVAGLLGRFALQLDWVPALMLTMVGEAVILMLQTAFRAGGAIGGFAAVLIGRNLLYLVALLAYQAVSRSGLSVGVVFLARGGCVMLVSAAAILAMRPVLRLGWARYADALRYGFPLLLTTLIFALTDMTDRWFLAEFTGLVAVGAYSLHLKVSGILSQAIVIPFGLWFPPERFRHLDAPDEGRGFFVRVAVLLLVACCYLSGAVWLARDLVLSILAPGVVASPFVLACCLGAVVCLAFSQALNVGLLMPGHTVKNALCTVYSVVAAVVVAAALVPLEGAAGAAISRLVGAVVLLVTTASASERVFPIAFPFSRMLLYIGVMCVAAAGVDRLALSPGWLPTGVALAVWTVVSALLARMFWRDAVVTGRSARGAREPHPQPLSNRAAPR